MVSFRSLVAAAALIAAPVMAAVTPQQIADGLATLRTKFQALQSPAQSITVLNGPLIAIGQGPYPIIIQGLNDITSTGNALLAQFPGTDPIPEGPDTDLVVGAFRALVAVEQAFLNIMIGKAGLFSIVPVIGNPVAQALRAVEGVEDSIAVTLIQLITSTAGDITGDANSLDATLRLCIDVYDGLS